MTSISSVTSSTSVLGQSATKPKSALDVAANLFGMSKSDLISELKSGKSLDDVAKEKGISSDDLVGALVKNMPSALASSGDPTQIAQNIAAQVGLPQGPGGPPPGAGSDNGSTSADASDSATASGSSASVLDEISTLLNTDPSTLKDELTSGTSLSDLMSATGVSLSSLADVVQKGILYDNSL